MAKKLSDKERSAIASKAAKKSPLEQVEPRRVQAG